MNAAGLVRWRSPIASFVPTARRSRERVAPATAMNRSGAPTDRRSLDLPDKYHLQTRRFLLR